MVSHPIARSTMAEGALPGRKPGMRTRPARRRSDAWTAASTSSAVASTWRATWEAALRSSVTVIPGVSVIWVLMFLGWVGTVRGPRLELGRVAPRDPKSRASTDSAIRARSVEPARGQFSAWAVGAIVVRHARVGVGWIATQRSLDKALPGAYSCRIQTGR